MEGPGGSLEATKTGGLEVGVYTCKACDSSHWSLRAVYYHSSSFSERNRTQNFKTKMNLGSLNI